MKAGNPARATAFAAEADLFYYKTTKNAAKYLQSAKHTRRAK